MTVEIRISLLIFFLPCLAIGVGSCIGSRPDMPPEGSWTIEYPDELPFQVKSVIVSGDDLTVTVVNNSGEEEWAKYLIQQ